MKTAFKNQNTQLSVVANPKEKVIKLEKINEQYYMTTDQETGELEFVQLWNSEDDKFDERIKEDDMVLVEHIGIETSRDNIYEINEQLRIAKAAWDSLHERIHSLEQEFAWAGLKILNFNFTDKMFFRGGKSVGDTENFSDYLSDEYLNSLTSYHKKQWEKFERDNKRFHELNNKKDA